MQNHQPTPLRSGPACAAVAPLVARRVGQHPLNHQETQTLQAHLETCAACHAELDSYQQLDETLARHFAPPESDPLSAEEISAILEQTVPSAEKALVPPLKTTSRRAVRPLPLPAEPPKRRSTALLSTLGALAAVVVIAAAGLALFASRPSTPGQNTPKPLLYAFLSNGALVALSPSNGKVSWQVSLGAIVSSGPVVAHGMVYVGTDDYQLHALDAKTGAQRWRYQADSGFQLAAGNGIVALTLFNGTVVALRASDGLVLWQKPGVGYVEGTPPLVADGVVYVAGTRGVWALTARTGSLRWYYPILSGEASPLLLADGAIHTLGMDGIFYSLNASDGSLRWQFTYGGGPLKVTLAAADGRLYLDGDEGTNPTEPQGRLDALDLSTGTPLWSGIPNGFQALSAGEGNVYVKVGQTMAAFAGADGSQRWSAPIAGVSASSLGKGTLYVGSTNGNVYALKTSDGSATWQAFLGQATVSRLVLG